jgi:membrane-associated phospholipid phosphatase
VVKILIHRPRPTLENAILFLSFAEPSFPSGHVVHYVVFFGFLSTVMIVDKGIPLFWRYFVGIISAYLILTVSISRIYLGAHWATDVIGGYLFGIVYLGIILKFYLKDPKFKHP